MTKKEFKNETQNFDSTHTDSSRIALNPNKMHKFNKFDMFDKPRVNIKSSIL